MENQGREASLHAAGDIIGWVFVTCERLKVSQGPVPCAEAIKHPHKSCLCISNAPCHDCWGTKAARQELAPGAVQQQNPP